MTFSRLEEAKRDTHTHPRVDQRVYYTLWRDTGLNGHFEGPGTKNTKISEVVECNIKWGAEGSLRKGKCCCEYKDIKTGTEWQCERPNKLSCDKLVGHSMGRFESPLNRFENQLFSK